MKTKKRKRKNKRIRVNDKVRNKILTKNGYKCRYCKQELHTRETFCKKYDTKKSKIANIKVNNKNITVVVYYYETGDYIKYQSLYATIDHIRPLSKGGNNDESNLTVACYDCNLKKGNSKRSVSA